MNSGRDDLIICTRDRPDELDACLESVRLQTSVPDFVVVVDSSSDESSQRVTDAHAADWPSGSMLAWVASAAGLPHQRKVGLAITAGSEVHFIDDDVVLEPGYFAGVQAAFASDDSIGGVGGFITNQPPHRFRRLDEWLGLDGRREGAVLPSGRNVRVHAEPDDVLDVDWLPGCAMSFRRAVLIEAPPDEHAPFDGEDVELSYRVRQHRRLVVTPHARLEHLESPVGRRRPAELAAPELVARHRRVAAGTGTLSTRAFWVSAWGQLAWFGTKGLITGSRDRLAIAKGTARGIAQALTYARRHR